MTVSTLRRLLARARKQTERVRVNARSESTKVLEHQNADLKKELAHTKAALLRAQREAATAVAERDEALSWKVGSHTVTGAQSLKRGREYKILFTKRAHNAAAAAAAGDYPAAKKRMGLPRVQVPSDASNASGSVAPEPVSTSNTKANEHPPTELLDAHRTSTLLGGRANCGDFVKYKDSVNKLWPSFVKSPLSNLTVSLAHDPNLTLSLAHDSMPGNLDKASYLTHPKLLLCCVALTIMNLSCCFSFSSHLYSGSYPDLQRRQKKQMAQKRISNINAGEGLRAS